MKAKERGICEKAANLWGQAVDEGYQETDDRSGLTIEMFKGAHYAMGALKGFWAPTKDGFLVINRAISELEALLNDESFENQASSDLVADNRGIDQLALLRKPSTKKPDPRAFWRITRVSDGAEGFFYSTQGVNGYSAGKYYEAAQPGERVNIDGEDLLPSEIPLDYAFEDDNISDAVLVWLENEFSFEIIRISSKNFEANIEISLEEGLVSVWDLSEPGADVWGYFNLSDYKLIECINEVMQSFDNFRVIFTGGAS